jgi:enamine deaminase RidA (YjgF/YER057c/UK114 family)
MIFLAGVGAEDENGKPGDIRHKDDFVAQCRYAYEKIRRALEKNGAGFGDIVKIVSYVTDMRSPHGPHPEEAALFARPSRRMAAGTASPVAVLRDADLRSAPQDEVGGSLGQRASIGHHFRVGAK